MGSTRTGVTRDDPAVRLGDVLLDLNRLLYYKGGHYISKRELVCSLETLAFRESLHFGFSESFPQKPRPRATLFTSEAAMDTQNVQQEAAESDVVTFLRRGGISILEATRREAARRVRRGDTPKARR